ncbi:hypothetical protein ACF1FE_19965 [Streptomyces griseofuscus]|uniref:hypothetical protein n=1 Tax=Streptomyces griseofuscus TaxID=146922 RepID=UPI0037002BB0
MPDRRNGPGDERYPTSRYARPPDEEWAPETEQREEHGTEGLRPGTEQMGTPGRDPGTIGREPGTAGRDPGAARRDPETARRDRDMAGRDQEVAGRDPGRDRSMTARGESDLGTSAPAPDAARMPDDGLGAPAPGDLSGREARTTEGTAPDAWPARAGDGAAGASSAAVAPLLPHEETERWEERMRQVAAGFVDRPRAAVEEADRALEEIAARFGEAVTRRRRSLRMSWEDGEERGPANETDTEQLRLAMRDYRDLAERLLHS